MLEAVWVFAHSRIYYSRILLHCRLLSFSAWLVFFLHLTGKFNYVFVQIKGMLRAAAQDEALKLLDLMKMSGSRDKETRNLSGGMKRKLSLGVAIIGGSKVRFFGSVANFQRIFFLNISQTPRKNGQKIVGKKNGNGMTKNRGKMTKTGTKIEGKK